jgi:hypothetical protein
MHLDITDSGKQSFDLISGLVEHDYVTGGWI